MTAAQYNAKIAARAEWTKKYFAANPGAKTVTRPQLVAFYRAEQAKQAAPAPAKKAKAPKGSKVAAAKIDAKELAYLEAIAASLPADNGMLPGDV